jgi:hypothetical protein
VSAFANCGHNSFWAKKLLERGYLFDVFRQKFWGDDRVGPWYRQNTFVYVKPHHPLFRALTVDGHGACDSLAFLDCIHPWLYFHVLDELKKRSPPLAHAAPPELVQKLPRNELCHCGSGKRFKHCHGKLDCRLGARRNWPCRCAKCGTEASSRNVRLPVPRTRIVTEGCREVQRRSGGKGRDFNTAHIGAEKYGEPTPDSVSAILHWQARPGHCIIYMLRGSVCICALSRRDRIHCGWLEKT